MFYVYILASQRNGTLYIGITNNIVRRINEHKSGISDGFTKKYNVKRLVYCESTEDVWAALVERKTVEKMAAKMEAAISRKRKSILA